MKKTIKYLGIVLSVIALLIVGFFGVLTITEYKPEDQVTLEIEGKASKTISLGDTITIATLNCGYGALQDDADFFMDGGSSVNTASKSQVMTNMNGLIDTLKDINADVMFLQEVDTSSSRSHHINEKNMFTSSFDGYNSSYAYNFKCLYIPYPLPPIGNVNSGILTISNLTLDSSIRQKLPTSFSWPVSMCNLKRCLLISRVSIEGSDKELVLINLHLEAYDDGEGKIKQTKLLKSILESEVKKGNYVIAGGDFNQVFSNYDLSAYPIVSEDLWKPGNIDVEEFNSSATLVTDPSSPTCRSLDKPYKDANKDTFQYYVIDGFAVSKNLEISNVKTINKDFKNTDHNPVTMTVSLK